MPIRLSGRSSQDDGSFAIWTYLTKRLIWIYNFLKIMLPCPIDFRIMTYDASHIVVWYQVRQIIIIAGENIELWDDVNQERLEDSSSLSSVSLIDGRLYLREYITPMQSWWWEVSIKSWDNEGFVTVDNFHTITMKKMTRWRKLSSSGPIQQVHTPHYYMTSKSLQAYGSAVLPSPPVLYWLSCALLRSILSWWTTRLYSWNRYRIHLTRS